MKFHIADMTCGHCVSMVTKAILTADGDAKIQTNLTDKTLQLSTELSSAEVMEVLTEAGYPATEVKASCCNPANSCHSA
ncbi:copper chaperone [Vibrio cholerae]|uniref:Heavy-metal-associated domain-containing protein n=1 Tax=Rheinheimera marina TaxID=1774958 RepID=A0ABV9JRS7_9GAMM|nr:copper chaperone [Vibrio cholerae]